MVFDINSILKQIAKDEGVPIENVREEIQKALDIAWESKNEQEIENQNKIFPKGKPNVEEFLKTVYGKIKLDD